MFIEQILIKSQACVTQHLRTRATAANLIDPVSGLTQVAFRGGRRAARQIIGQGAVRGRAVCSCRGGWSWWCSCCMGSDRSHIPTGSPASGRVRAGWASSALEGLDQTWSTGDPVPTPHPLHGAGTHSWVYLGFCVKGDGHRRPGFWRQRLGGLDLHDSGEGSKESGERSSPAIGSGKKQGASACGETSLRHQDWRCFGAALA